MAEYIDREALLSEIDDAMDADGMGFVVGTTIKRYLKRQPIADVAPVKYGQWEWFDEETGTPITGHEREWGWRCSRCKHELPDDYDDPDYRPMLDYCLYCGAKMDGGVDNG